jgi:S-adenosylmethionine decarboxylase
METLKTTIQEQEILYPANGKHLLVTFKNCATNILNSEDSLRSLVYDASIATGATVLEVCSHKFQPQGVTALTVLAESHASLHTYPESNVVFWDCFTCGDACNPELSIAVLAEALQPETIEKQLILRG